MRAVAALTLITFFLHVSVFGQAAQKTSTFTNSDRAFRFVYPTEFPVCTLGKIDTCIQSYIPLCEQDALVCVVYPIAPTAEFKDTNFGAAAFRVKEISTEQEMMTADVCVTPYPRRAGDTASAWPEFLISAEHPAEMIGGIRFVHGVSGGAATGHSSVIDLYRTFYKQRCFELSINEEWTNPNISDPPLKILSTTQQQKLDQTMSDILHSFRFITAKPQTLHSHSTTAR